MLKVILTSLVSVVGYVVLTNPVGAVTSTLTNNSGATVTYENGDSGTSGFSSWRIGAKDILTESAIYYGVGSTPGETRLNLPTLTQTAANTANGTFNGGDFTIDLELLLSDTDSQLSQTITIRNTSDSALALKLFKYFDLKTSNSPIEETASIDADFKATQLGDVDSITTTVSETPNAAEVDALDFENDIIERLNSGITTTLDNSKLGPVGPDDLTYAYEWNFNIAADDSISVTVNSSSSLSTPPIPVPFEFSPTFGLVLLLLALAGERSYKYWYVRSRWGKAN